MEKEGDERDISRSDEPSNTIQYCKSTSNLTRSQRFESLLHFLDEENCIALEADDDNQRRSKSSSITLDSRRSLLDITNSTLQSSQTLERISCQNKEKLKNQSDRVNDGCLETELAIAPSNKSKKYIWEEWDLEVDNGAQDEEKKDIQMAGDSQAEKISAARQQLIQLKAAGEEIQARATKLKSSQGALKAEIDRLHSIRIEQEANHVKNMRTLKLKFVNRKAKTEAETEKIIIEQKKVHDDLTTAKQRLEKKETRLMAELEKIAINRKETCERLKKEGLADMQVSKKSWAHAEENDMEKKERKLASKLKRDAANAVEPKLRQLIETNAEELDRLQRQAARELDSYKLELFSKMNREFKTESDNIRKMERQRNEQLEGDLMRKLNALQTSHLNDIEKKAKEHEHRMQIIKQQFDTDKQRLIREHEVAQEDAKNTLESQMNQVSRAHQLELATMEKEHKDKIRTRQQQNKLDIERWRTDRGNELQQLESDELKQAEEDMKQKMNAELDLVSKKLNEEAREKRVQMSLEINEKNMIVKARYQKELAQAETASSALKIQEEEACSNFEEARREMSRIMTSIHDKEDGLILQKNAFETFLVECDQVCLDKKREGDRKVSLAKSQLHSLEKELDDLISTHPQRLDERQKEIKSLKLKCDHEVKLAQDKVASLLEKKNSAVEDASARVALLQKDIAEIERQMDEARSRKILGIREKC